MVILMERAQMPRTLDMPLARHLFFPAWGGLRRTRTREDHHGRKSSSLQFRGMSVAIPRGGGTAPLSSGGEALPLYAPDSHAAVHLSASGSSTSSDFSFRLTLPLIGVFGSSTSSSGSPSRALSSSCVKTLLRACRTKTMTIRKKGKTTATCLI